MPLSKRPLHVAACAKTETDIEVRQVMLSASGLPGHQLRLLRAPGRLNLSVRLAYSRWAKLMRLRRRGSRMVLLWRTEDRGELVAIRERLGRRTIRNGIEG